MNEATYEIYCMEKLHLENELDELEFKKESLLQELKDLESDIEFTQNRLDNLDVEDFYCE